MSPRAAWRLEAFGYTQVYDYVVGKADWLAAGLATEGDQRHPTRVVAAMRQAPTCTPDETVAVVAGRLEATADAVCVAVNDHNVVQGRLRRDRVDPADGRRVGESMEPGPATVRADAALAETLERMKQRNVRTLIVSTPDGVLLGVVANEPESEPPT